MKHIRFEHHFVTHSAFESRVHSVTFFIAPLHMFMRFNFMAIVNDIAAQPSQLRPISIRQVRRVYCTAAQGRLQDEARMPGFGVLLGTPWRLAGLT